MNARALASVALLLLGTVRAQDDAAVVPLRVVSVAADGKVVIDRGSRDLLQVGDRVDLLPADGQRLSGNVVQVDERSAMVELAGGARAPAAGTKGEVRIPRARAAARPPTPRPTPVAPPTPAPAPAPPSDYPARDGWKPGMPLLANVDAVRPEQRTPSLRGRVFSVLGGAGTTSGDHFDPYARIGTELDAGNALSLGGELHFDAELDYRTEVNEQAGLDLLLRRFSWSKGGDRFERDRFEFGRFLHHVFPELGVVDGGEWTRRLENGSRIGASFGFLPEPDDDFESFSDLQVSAYYEWVADADETTRLGAAFQKTWHNGAADRDAILLTLHQVPIDGWQVHGWAWIDFYTSGDDIKGPGMELTSGNLSFGRRFSDSSGFDIGIQRTRYPDIQRREFPVLPPAELADERYDRLLLDTFAVLPSGERAHAHLTGFDDEERLGGAAELGFALPERVGQGTTLDLVGFAGRAQFERLFGGRASLSRLAGLGYWQVLYEVGWHRLDDRPADGDDLIQHRLALSLNHTTESGWIVGASADAVWWDSDLGWTLNFTLQRSF